MAVFQIKSRRGAREVLYKRDCNSLRLCVQAAVLEGITLAHADLRDANLICTILSNAKLSHVDLRSADLSNANLRGANLCFADLTGVALSFTYMNGVQLRGAKGILTVGPIDTWLMYAVRHDDGPRIYAGCRGPFCEAEARAYWHGDRPSHDARMIAGLDALLALAAAHGWPISEATP